MYCLNVCLCVLGVPMEVIGSPEIRVTGSSELRCGCWESNPGLLQDQEVFLIAESTLSFLTTFHWEFILLHFFS